jgi:chaperonin cofactor prefoldin
MKYPVHNFKEKWYNAQGFGVKTSYGYHEGTDLNLKTGGDSDLGQELLAIADGEITSVHSHTGIPTFGKHLHLKINTPFGIRWIHYCHCQDILVPEGAKVLEGQLIAKVGKSGTTVSHLHFAIKNQPTGIDGIAKTQDDLLKWEDPIPFIEKCIQKEKEVLNEQALKDKISDLETKVATLNEAVASKSLEVNHLRTELEAQERDNQDLSAQLTESRKQRDQFKAEKEALEIKATNLQKAIDVANTELNALKSQITALEKVISDNKSLVLSNVNTGLIVKELFFRIWTKTK